MGLICEHVYASCFQDQGALVLGTLHYYPGKKVDAGGRQRKVVMLEVFRGSDGIV